jgi:Flp pilus assembly protein TadD
MKTRLQQWGLALIVMGGASFILPAAGMQLRIFNLFGGATPAVSIGVIVLGAVLWLVGAMLGRPAPAQIPRTQAAAGSAPTPPPKSPRSTPYCPKCGATVTPGDRFCIECGNPLPQAASGPPPAGFAPSPPFATPISQRPKQRRGRFVLVLVMAGVLLLVAGVGLSGAIVFWWFTTGSKQWTSSKTAATPISTPGHKPLAPPSVSPTPAIAAATRPIASATPTIASATPAKTYFDQGHKEAENGDFQKAIPDYTEAIRLAPDYAIAYLNRAMAYNKLDQYDNAISDFTKVIELKPDALTYFYRGLVYNELKQYGNAISDFTKAIQLKPDPLTYNNRGIAYYWLKQYNYAISDFTDAIQLKQDPLYYRNRASAYQLLGRLAEAEQDRQKAQQLEVSR